MVLYTFLLNLYLNTLDVYCRDLSELLFIVLEFSRQTFLRVSYCLKNVSVNPLLAFRERQQVKGEHIYC